MQLLRGLLARLVVAADKLEVGVIVSKGAIVFKHACCHCRSVISILLLGISHIITANFAHKELPIISSMDLIVKQKLVGHIDDSHILL